MRGFRISFLSVVVPFVTVAVSLSASSGGGSGKHVLISEGRKSFNSIPKYNRQQNCPSHGCSGNLTDTDKSKQRLKRSSDYGAHFSVENFAPTNLPGIHQNHNFRHHSSPFDQASQPSHNNVPEQIAENSNLKFQEEISSIVPTPITAWPPHQSNTQPPQNSGQSQTFYINLNNPEPVIQTNLVNDVQYPQNLGVTPPQNFPQNQEQQENPPQQNFPQYQEQEVNAPQHIFPQYQGQQLNAPQNRNDQFSHLKDLFTPDSDPQFQPQLFPQYPQFPQYNEPTEQEQFIDPNPQQYNQYANDIQFADSNNQNNYAQLPPNSPNSNYHLSPSNDPAAQQPTDPPSENRADYYDGRDDYHYRPYTYPTQQKQNGWRPGGWRSPGSHKHSQKHSYKYRHKTRNELEKKEAFISLFIAEAIWQIISSVVFVSVTNSIIAFIGKALGLNDTYLETKIVLGKGEKHPFEHYASGSGGASKGNSGGKKGGWPSKKGSSFGSYPAPQFSGQMAKRPNHLGKGKKIYYMSNPIYHPSTALYQQPTYQYYPKGKEYTMHAYDQYQAIRYAHKYAKKYSKHSGKYGVRPKPILPYIPSYNYAQHSIPWGRDDLGDSSEEEEKKKRRKKKPKNKASPIKSQKKIDVEPPRITISFGHGGGAKGDTGVHATPIDTVGQWLINSAAEELQSSTGRSSADFSSTDSTSTKEPTTTTTIFPKNSETLASNSTEARST